MSSEIEVTEITIRSVRNPKVSRVKATAVVTFNGILRVSGVKIIEGVSRTFVSWPSERKEGTDQWYPLFQAMDRAESLRIQEIILHRYEESKL